MSRIWTVSNINLLFFRTLLISAYVHFDVFLYLCRHLTLLLRTTISCPLGLSLTILFSKNMPENQASLPEESGQIWMQWTSYHVSCVMHGALRKEWHEHETTLTSSRGAECKNPSTESLILFKIIWRWQVHIFVYRTYDRLTSVWEWSISCQFWAKLV